jgi:chromosome segregation and condensation protein ScpB
MNTDARDLDSSLEGEMDLWTHVDRRAIVLSVLLQTRRDTWTSIDLASHIHAHHGPKLSSKAVQLTLLELAGELESATWFPYRLHEIAEAWTLVLKFPPLRRVMTDARPMHLDSWEREVLSCVAYCQPVTRNAVQTIMGREPERSVAKLIEKGLLGTVTEGCYQKLVTTKKFLREFYLRAVEDMPNYDELRKAGLERSCRVTAVPSRPSLGFTPTEVTH